MFVFVVVGVSCLLCGGGMLDFVSAPCDDSEDECQGSTASMLARVDYYPKMCEGVAWDTAVASCLGDFDDSGHVGCGGCFFAVLFISSVDVMQNCEGSLSRDKFLF